MFGGPWDSTLIMMGVPSLKMGVPSFYIYIIIGKLESLRNNLGIWDFNERYNQGPLAIGSGGVSTIYTVKINNRMDKQLFYTS